MVPRTVFVIDGMWESDQERARDRGSVRSNWIKEVRMHGSLIAGCMIDCLAEWLGAGWLGARGLGWAAWINVGCARSFCMIHMA